MKNYYAQHLSAERLHLCYKIGSDRIKQYQRAETATVLDRLKPGDVALDLGCGYGRVLKLLHNHCRNLFGVDISRNNLEYARNYYLKNIPCGLLQMNAVNLGFYSASFDLVFCIQNGISAFKEEPAQLLSEAIRVTKPGGTVLFSSYSHHLWEVRLEWFEAQSEHGLVGAIDYDLTANGTIVCKDGFKATTYSLSDFQKLTGKINKDVKIFEVDQSSVFCEITV